MLGNVIDTRKDIATLDIGTSKICCSIAKKESKDRDLESLGEGMGIRIFGVGTQQARGIKKFSLTNLEELEESILGALSTTSRDAQKSIKSLIVSLPSWAFESLNIQSSIELGQMPIDEIHINTLLNLDLSKYVDPSREIIHIFPVAYSVDGNDDVQDPIGMIGDKLTVIIHILSVSSSLIKNIRNCLNRNNIEVEAFVCSTYSSALSVLLKEEITSGVTLIDFGGAMTSIAFFKDNSFLHLETIPMGSDNISNDLSIILRTGRAHAERLKILYGVGNGEALPNNDEQCVIPRIDEYGEKHIQNISRGMIDSIISSRLEEIMELVQRRIERCGADKVITQRMVITGGGSMIAGLNEFLKIHHYFPNSSVRLGKPIATTGSHDFVKTASFASCAGNVLLYLQRSSLFFGLSNQKKSLAQKLTTWFKRGI